MATFLELLGNFPYRGFLLFTYENLPDFWVNVYILTLWMGYVIYSIVRYTLTSKMSYTYNLSKHWYIHSEMFRKLSVYVQYI
jgi:hypothetical protein